MFTAFILPGPGSIRKEANFNILGSIHALFASDVDVSGIESSSDRSAAEGFDLNTALFCGGLAFDAYLEPPTNSSRWERGSKGMNVAFLSQAFTRNLYKGLVEGACGKQAYDCRENSCPGGFLTLFSIL